MNVHGMILYIILQSLCEDKTFSMSPGIPKTINPRLIIWLLSWLHYIHR